MSFQLDSGEPEGGPWRAEPLTAVIEALVRLGGERAKGGRGIVLAVDGRSSSGKTTLAARLQDVAAGSAVVHTDDIAWWYSRFGWDDLLIDGVLVPFHRGEHVSFRPPCWDEHGRRGFIQVPARCPVLIIEGVGAGRSEVLALDRHAGMGAGRPARSRTAQPGMRWPARRAADSRELSGVDGRGGTVSGTSAAVGARGHASGRYSPDLFRSSLGSYCRAAAQALVPTPRVQPAHAGRLCCPATAKCPGRGTRLRSCGPARARVRPGASRDGSSGPM